jgi:hypothetical protein
MDKHQNKDNLDIEEILKEFLIISDDYLKEEYDEHDGFVIVDKNDCQVCSKKEKKENAEKKT